LWYNKNVYRRETTTRSQELVSLGASTVVTRLQARRPVYQRLFLCRGTISLTFLSRSEVLELTHCLIELTNGFSPLSETTGPA